MPADRRLTIETVKPGMKVKPIGALRVYHVRDVDVGGHLNLEEHDGVYRIEDFIPADPEPAPSWATEELRKALLAWKHVWDTSTFPDETTDYSLNDAIEASGLLPRAPARTTLPAMYLGAEAFEESGS